MEQNINVKNEIIMDYIIYNGKTVKTIDFDYCLIGSSPAVYEVIRIIDGVSLFLEKHLSRFNASSKLLGFELSIDDKALSEYIKELVKINKIESGNVKIVMNNLNSTIQNSYVYFIASKYPTKDEIANGVPTIFFHGERDNPNAKIISASFRNRVNEEIVKHSAYEALLVNRNDEVTEGSRSNYFAVKSDIIYTPPVESVLPGITRGYILDICHDLNMHVVQQSVKLDFLTSVDGLFISGTSPQVLPVSCVNNIKFSSGSNKIIINIREQYEKLVKEYIDGHK